MSVGAPGAAEILSVDLAYHGTMPALRPLALVALLVPAAAGADVFDPSYTESQVTVTGAAIDHVTSMAWAPDGSGRLFLTGKNGPVWIVKNGVASIFATLTNVETDSECGVLSIAVDPRFMDNGYVYVFVTRQAPLEQQIVRFTAVGDLGTSETPIITGLSTNRQNHDGGGMEFGPDGMLYWAVGNNGNGTGQGTDLQSSASKLGRASPVPGAAPPADNPFNDGSGPNYDYIWARGFRNPFTLTFRPETGALWVNVVGDNFEQIFDVPRGAHVGYPSENPDVGEGGATISPILVYNTGSPPARTISGASVSGDTVTLTTADANGFRKGNAVTIAGLAGFTTTNAVSIRSIVSANTFTIDRGDNDPTGTSGTATLLDFGNVVAGGTFYNATQFPPADRGAYFFGDFGAGNIGRLTVADDGSVATSQLWGDGIGDWIDGSTGPDGALWYVRHYGGQIYRTVYSGWGSAQGIVVAPLNLRVVEGSRGVVGVHLRIQPSAPVTVNIARQSGSETVSVPGASLHFDGTNWDQPQYVTVSAAQSSTTNDLATVAFSSPSDSIGAELITVRVTDSAPTGPIPDGGVGMDAGMGADAPPGGGDGGPTGGSSDGCSCGVAGTGPILDTTPLLGLGLVLLRRRRRRDPRTPSTRSSLRTATPSLTGAPSLRHPS